MGTILTSAYIFVSIMNKEITILVVGVMGKLITLSWNLGPTNISLLVGFFRIFHSFIPFLNS